MLGAGTGTTYDPKALKLDSALLQPLQYTCIRITTESHRRTLMTLKSAKKRSERFACRFAMQGPDDGRTVLETQGIRSWKFVVR